MISARSVRTLGAVAIIANLLFILLDILRYEPVTVEDVSLHTLIFGLGTKLLQTK